jgi:hypothetical protein
MRANGMDLAGTESLSQNYGYWELFSVMNFLDLS